MAPKYFPHFIVKMQTKYWLFLYQKELKWNMKEESYIDDEVEA